MRKTKKIFKKNGKLCKNTKRKKLQKGGLNSPYNNVFVTPSWRMNCNTLTRVNRTEFPNLYLYGTSLPFEDVYACFANMMFYMNVKYINKLLSLHSCPDIQTIDPANLKSSLCEGKIPVEPGSPALPIDVRWEERAWNAAKVLTAEHENDPTILYENIYIRDMTAGMLDAWERIKMFNCSNANETSIVHCLAGKGRTGTFLLFKMLQHHFDNNILDTALFQQPFLGYGDSRTMYLQLFLFLRKNIAIDTEPNNGPLQPYINRFDKMDLVSEVFSINSKFLVDLFVTRINYILLFIANNYFLDQDIILYDKNKAVPNDPDNVFKPVTVNLQHATTFPSYHKKFGLII